MTETPEERAKAVIVNYRRYTPGDPMQPKLVAVVAAAIREYGDARAQAAYADAARVVTDLIQLRAGTEATNYALAVAVKALEDRAKEKAGG